MMLANFHVFGIMMVFSAMHIMFVKCVSPRRPMCSRCLMFSLSDPVELFVLCLMVSWTSGVVRVCAFWFNDKQQDSFMKMFADGLVRLRVDMVHNGQSLILKFRLRNIQDVGICNFLSNVIPHTITIRKN